MSTPAHEFLYIWNLVHPNPTNPSSCDKSVKTQGLKDILPSISSYCQYECHSIIERPLYLLVFELPQFCTIRKGDRSLGVVKFYKYCSKLRVVQLLRLLDYVVPIFLLFSLLRCRETTKQVVYRSNYKKFSRQRDSYYRDSKKNFPIFFGVFVVGRIRRLSRSTTTITVVCATLNSVTTVLNCMTLTANVRTPTIHHKTSLRFWIPQ